MTISSEESSLAKDSLVYRIIIDDEINPSVSRLVRRGIEEAEKREADYLFIELETYGGLVVDADDIRTDILNCPIPTSSISKIMQRLPVR